MSLSLSSGQSRAQIRCVQISHMCKLKSWKSFQILSILFCVTSERHTRHSWIFFILLVHDEQYCAARTRCRLVSCANSKRTKKSERKKKNVFFILCCVFYDENTLAYTLCAYSLSLIKIPKFECMQWNVHKWRLCRIVAICDESTLQQQRKDKSNENNTSNRRRNKLQNVKLRLIYLLFVFSDFFLSDRCFCLLLCFCCRCFVLSCNRCPIHISPDNDDSLFHWSRAHSSFSMQNFNWNCRKREEMANREFECVSLKFLCVINELWTEPKRNGKNARDDSRK